MQKLLKSGQLIFAVGIIALGILSIVSKDFIVGRPPAWPAGFGFNPPLAYVAGAILVIGGILVILEKKGIIASLTIAAMIFLFSVLRHLPHFMDDWANSYKAMALFGGCLVVAASFFN
ncbi:MAG: hypothetical protein ABIS01_06110, partial [Ferruginibacter sp.]